MKRDAINDISDTIRDSLGLSDNNFLEEHDDIDVSFISYFLICFVSNFFLVLRAVCTVSRIVAAMTIFSTVTRTDTRSMATVHSG